MLYDAKTHQPVFIPKGKCLSDHMKASVIEKLEPLPTKNNYFFSIEKRARMSSK